MRPIAQHHYSVESQARFRTIPVNELIDGVTITPLGVQASEAIQDCATFQFLTTGLRGDVKESRKYAAMNSLRHKVQYHGNSSVRYTPYLTWVLTANS